MARFGARLVVSMVVLGTLAFGAPETARAQTTQKTKLSELLPNLYIDNVSADGAILASVVGVPVTPAFIAQLVNNIQPALLVDQLLGVQVSSFPLGSSAGGFTWTFDPSLGTFNRVSESFGPVFAERALTVGKNRFNLGFNFQRATFDSVQDKDLDGEIKVYSSVPVAGSAVFIQEALFMKLSTNIVGLFATYGVTNKLDVGVAVPIVHVSMNARLDAQVGSGSTLQPNVFAGDPVKGSATGIGDIVLRGKYNLLAKRGGGIAGGVDLRLPTGDEEDLLGIGGPQAKFYAALSAASGRFSPHFNIGYTVSGKSSAAKDPDTFVFPPPDELSYAGGVDVALTPKLTVLGDFTGRSLRDSGVISLQQVSFSSAFSQFSYDDGSLNQVLGSVGVKYNVFGTSLVSANVLFPLNKSGLRDNLTWVLGFERSFSIKK